MIRDSEILDYKLHEFFVDSEVREVVWDMGCIFFFHLIYSCEI